MLFAPGRIAQLVRALVSHTRGPGVRVPLRPLCGLEVEPSISSGIEEMISSESFTIAETSKKEICRPFFML